jgi:hypothetical protein
MDYKDGLMVIVGKTFSSDFPSINASQAQKKGGSDGYVYGYNTISKNNAQ